MNLENIVFILIIAIAVIYLGRKIVLFFISKEPPSCNCSCCNKKCFENMMYSQTENKQEEEEN